MARALVNNSAKVKRGDVGEIKVLISHPMKRGFRPGPDGKFFPRDTLKSFACPMTASMSSARSFSPPCRPTPNCPFRWWRPRPAY